MAIYFICSSIRDGPEETWNAKVAATYVLRLLRLNKFDFVSILLQSIQYRMARKQFLLKNILCSEAPTSQQVQFYKSFVAIYII